MQRALLLVTALLVACGSVRCAAFGQQCAAAGFDAAVRVCLDVLCDSDGAKSVVEDASRADAPASSPEPPVPDWQPGPGACEITRDLAGGVTVGCADGTRATFLPEGTVLDPPLVVERATDGERGHACAGGSVVREGLDADGDGALSTVEVTGHTVECPDALGVRVPTLVGHLAIHGPDDVARVAGRRALTGGLLVTSKHLVRLELPQLQSIGAALRVDGANAMETLALPSLNSINGDLVILGAVRLRALLTPRLTRLGGALIAVDNPGLAQTDLEELVFRLSRRGFAGSVELAGNRP